MHSKKADVTTISEPPPSHTEIITTQPSEISLAPSAIMGRVSPSIIGALVGPKTVTTLAKAAAALTCSPDFLQVASTFESDPFASDVRKYIADKLGTPLSPEAAAIVAILATTDVSGPRHPLSDFAFAAQTAIPETTLARLMDPELIGPPHGEIYRRLLEVCGASTDVGRSWDSEVTQAVRLKAAAIAIACSAVHQMLTEWQNDKSGWTDAVLSAMAKDTIKLKRGAGLVLNVPCIALVLDEPDFVDVATRMRMNPAEAAGFWVPGSSIEQKFDARCLLYVTREQPDLAGTIEHEREHVLGHILAGFKAPPVWQLSEALRRDTTYLTLDAPRGAANLYVALGLYAVRGELLAYRMQGAPVDRNPVHLQVDRVLGAIETLAEEHGTIFLAAHKHGVAEAVSHLFEAGPMFLECYRNDRRLMDYLEQNRGYHSAELCALMRNLPASGGIDGMRAVGVDSLELSKMEVHNFSKIVGAVYSNEEITPEGEMHIMTAIAMCHGQSTYDLLVYAAVTPDENHVVPALRASEIAAVEYLSRGGARSLEKCVKSLLAQTGTLDPSVQKPVAQSCERILRLIATYDQIYRPVPPMP